jgi:L-iditol 2-dehydrogenase
VPGHEIAGVIEALGEGVTSVRAGERVVVCPIVSCARCYFCLTGRRHRCLERKTLGYDEDGGLAEQLLVPAQIVSLGHLIPVPDGLAIRRAAITEPLACVLNSLETCGITGGSSLLIIGAGPMGLFHVLLARHLGAGTIIVSEPDAERRASALRFGASDALDPTSDDVRDAVRTATRGLGADAAVLAMGNAAALDLALASTRPQGFVNLFAGFPPNTSVQFDPNSVHYPEIRLTGSQNASPDQYRRVLQLLPRLDAADEITTHHFPLAEATRAYEVRLRNEGLKSMVLVDDGA